ncbi:porin [Amorphus sp. 3PC139-8]|uniref:porin n=1 Tax=Amorphus sp. 3PC139-8 TaxID=2735676 RepID=UPI00345DC816
MTGFSRRRRARRHGAARLWSVSGAAIALVGFGAGQAQAADLPPEPVAIDYVRACGAAGVGYYAIPGTNTCLSVSGEIDIDYIFNWAKGEQEPRWREADNSDFYVEAKLYLYSTTQTEFGALDTTTEIEIVHDINGAAQLSLEQAFVQFRGFSFGRGESFYDAANYVTWAEVYDPAQSDLKTTFAAYTAEFGKGFSATISAESSAERQLGVALYPYSGPLGAGTIYPDELGYGPQGNGYGGTKWPDAVGRLMTTGDWGSAQVTGALHQVYAAYDGSGVTPKGGLGWAVGAAATANLPNNVTLVANGTYSQGAAAYANGSWFGLPNQGTLAYDASYDPASGDLALATAFSMSFGAAFDVAAAQLAVQAGWSRFEDSTLQDVSGGANSADFNQYDLQAQIGFEPVNGLTLGVGAEYQYLDHDDPLIGEEQQLSTYFHVDRVF